MSHSSEYPDFFARFYDVIYDQVRNDADHEYFLNKMLAVNGPVLEVGVGTGRFFLEALNRGVDIYGIDLSPSMIEVLKDKLPENEHQRISIQDLCKLNLNKRFDLIVAPFRVFMHILKVEDQLDALNKVYDHLNPGGEFVFDLFVPNLKMLLQGLNNFNDFEGEFEPGKKLKRYSSMHADIINQISHVKFKLVWDEDGKEISKEWHTDMRFFFRYEIEHLIKQSKLKLVSIFGDFKENDLNKDSKEFIIICKRI